MTRQRTQVTANPKSSTTICLSAILALAAFAYAQPAEQTYQEKHFYVSPSGDDASPGTQDAPFKTFEKAVSLAGPGTTVHLLPPAIHVYVAPDGNDASPGTLSRPKRSLQAGLHGAKPGTIVHLGPGVYGPVSLEALAGEEHNPIVVRGPAAPPIDYGSLEALSDQNLRIEPIRKACMDGAFALGSTDGLAVIEAAGGERGVALRSCRELIFENLVIQNAEVNFHVSESNHVTLRDAILRENRKDAKYSSGLHLARLSAIRARKAGRDRPDEQSSHIMLHRVVSSGHFGEGFWIDLDSAVDVTWDRCVAVDNGHGQPAPGRFTKNRSAFIFAWSQRFVPRHHFIRCAALNNIADGFDLAYGIEGLVLEYCVADGNGRYGAPFVNLRAGGSVAEGHTFRFCRITDRLLIEGGTHRLEGLVVRQKDLPAE